MESKIMNQLNDTFKLNGSEGRRSLEIIKVKALNPENLNLQLQVLDEKNTPVFSQVLQFSPSMPEIKVNRNFIFSDHISIALTRAKQDKPFEIEIFYR